MFVGVGSSLFMRVWGVSGDGMGGEQRVFEIRETGCEERERKRIFLVISELGMDLG